MQTFLPYANFIKTAKCLDYKRLGKQRVEAKQIINTIICKKQNDLHIVDKNGKLRKRGWLNHPCVIMWESHLPALKAYHDIMIKEWIKRGYNNTMSLFNIESYRLPNWIGDNDFHISHQSNLLRKDFDYYSKFNWLVDSDLEYIWP